MAKIDRINMPATRRDSLRKLCRAFGIVAAALAAGGILTACDSPKKTTATEVPVPAAPPHEIARLEEPVLVPTARDGAAYQFVLDAALRAAPTRIHQSRVSYVLLGCVDTNGHIDRMSETCPGSIVATFEEEPNRSAFRPGRSPPIRQ